MRAQAPGETQQRTNRAREGEEVEGRKRKGGAREKKKKKRAEHQRSHGKKKVTQRETATFATQKAAVLGLGPPPQPLSCQLGSLLLSVSGFYSCNFCIFFFFLKDFV